MVARTVLNNLNSTDGMPTVLDILHSADDTLYSTDDIPHTALHILQCTDGMPHSTAQTFHQVTIFNMQVAKI